MNNPNIDIAALREAVGKSFRISDDLSPVHAQALAAALDHAVLPEAGGPLPPLYHFLYFFETPLARDTRGDGHPKSALGGLLPEALPPRRMMAGATMTFERPVILGKRAEKTSTVRTVDHKTGKSGDLVFVTLDHVITQDGHDCIHDEQTVVYRPFPTGPAPLPAGETPKDTATWKKEHVPDPVLLFRYSAMTYNGHRIHYDRTYAVEKEFYPALVVHGPLLATYLLDLTHANAPGKTLHKYSFRANRPTFDSRKLTVCGAPEDGGKAASLWTVDDEGFVGTTGRAQWKEGDSK